MILETDSVTDRRDILQVHRLAFEASDLGHRGEAELVDCLLRDCAGRVSLVARVGGRVAGHVLFTPARVDGSDVHGMGLAPIAVRPEYQRQGIGGRLIRAGIEQLTGSSCAFVVVLGPASYYPRFGFVPAERFGLTNSFGASAEHFFALELESGSLDGVGGVIRYRPEFDGLPG